MVRVKIFPTTQAAFVFSKMTYADALRHIGADCEADAFESSPEIMEEVVDYMMHIMQTEITYNEYIVIIKFIKPLLLFLFFKELMRLSPSYGSLEPFINKYYLEWIKNINNVGKYPASLKNINTMLNNSNGRMKGGDSRRNEYLAILKAITDWKRAVVNNIPDSDLSLLETDIKRKVVTYNGEHYPRIPDIVLDRENLRLADLPEYTIRSTCDKVGRGAKITIKAACVMIVCGIAGALSHGELSRRYNTTITSSTASKVDILRRNLQSCTTIKEGSPLGTFWSYMMTTPNECALQFQGTIDILERSRDRAISDYAQFNPIWTLADIPLINSVCTNVIVKSPTGYFCNIPVGFPDPMAGAVALQKYITSPVDDMWRPTPAAIEGAKQATAGVATEAAVVAKNANAFVRANVIRTERIKEEIAGQKEINKGFFSLLLSAGSAIATGLGLWSGSGTAAAIGQALGSGGDMLASAKNIPKLASAAASAAAGRATSVAAAMMPQSGKQRATLMLQGAELVADAAWNKYFERRSSSAAADSSDAAGNMVEILNAARTKAAEVADSVAPADTKQGAAEAARLITAKARADDATPRNVVDAATKYVESLRLSRGGGRRSRRRVLHRSRKTRKKLNRK